MKYALIFLLSTQAHAAPIELTCATNPLSTTFAIKERGDQLEATMIFHSGSAHAPAINGQFTPSDLPALAARAELVKKLRDRMEFTWPLKNCVRHDAYRFECFGSPDVQPGQNGEKIGAFALYTTRFAEDGIAGKLQTLRVTFSFTVDGKGDPSVAMDYPLEDCSGQ